MLRMHVSAAYSLVGLLVLAPLAQAQTPAPARSARAPRAATATAGAGRFDRTRLAEIPRLIEAAIARKELPGAVVAVGTEAGVAWQASVGQRALQPTPERMTTDTIFDAASLTKVVATTTAVMMLVEQGKLRLTDRVALHLPGFERFGKRDITIRHLLTHTSGLRPDLEFNPEWNGYDTAISKAIDEVPIAGLDARVIYSDINFFLLGHLVGLVSGEPLDEFTRTHVFVPLGMKDTMFKPPATLASRIAPDREVRAHLVPVRAGRRRVAPWRGARPDGPSHEQRGRARGSVHDGGRPGPLRPDAAQRRATRGRAHPVTPDRGPDDVALDARGPAQRPGPRVGHQLDLLGQQGRPDAVAIVRPHGLHRHVVVGGSRHEDVRRVPVEPGASRRQGRRHRAARPRGERRRGAIRVAPSPVVDTHDFAQVLAVRRRGRTHDHRPHDDRHRRAAGRGLRAAGGTQDRPAHEPHGTHARRAVHHRRVRTRRRTSSLVALFSPEHGIRGILDEDIPSSVDEKTGLTIHSLYGEDPPRDAGDAAGHRHDGRRPAGHRQPLLHVSVVTRLPARGGRAARHRGRRAGSAQPDQRLAGRGPEAGPAAGRAPSAASSRTSRRCRCGTG